MFEVEMVGPPKFLGSPDVHLLMFFDPGRTTMLATITPFVLLPLKRK